ncbi:hypothetical protein EYC80_006791 [Monilinia laxa]|uniref:Helicase ATP-binding domain-containing protein n=1 Tax=Monilinia laxa TaxID=61186 RepID=A0A5N6JZ86_MONLA|nr:hypothetical protein EYC80_006791 [Monilinia laxa]
MIRKLIPYGRLFNPLHRRHASTQWIRSKKYLSVKYYSTSLALQDDTRDEKPQPSTTNDWLFQIPPNANLPNELGVPLPPTAIFVKDPIDWEAVDRILEKRPYLARAINFGKSGYRDLPFISSLAGLSSLLRHGGLCVFEFQCVQYTLENGPSYVAGKSLNKCHLTCDLTKLKGFSTLSRNHTEPPLKITVIATRAVPAQNAALLQLLLVLEEKQLLDVFLSLVPSSRISKEAKNALNNNILKPSVESPPLVTNKSSEIILTPTVLSAAKMEPAAVPQEEPTPKSSRVTREVFNYAASYLCIPKYTVTFQTVSTSKRKKCTKKYVTVEISLPEHGIYATATGLSLNSVEIMACVNFKKEAEKYHIANVGLSHPLKRPITLSTENARNFLDFYNDYNEKVTIQITRRNDEFWTGQAFAKGSNPISREILDQAITRNSINGLEQLVTLATAITLAKKRPELLVDYEKKLDSRTGKYVSKALPMKLELHQSSLDLMKRTVETTERLGLSSTPEDESVDDDAAPFSRHNPFQCSEEFSQQRSRHLLKWWYDQSLVKYRKGDELPLNKRSSEVLSLVENNQYSILIGQTGSGKTTQLPQIILDEYIRQDRGGDCKVVCTQPRRIAATSVAHRVAKERRQDLGDQVGYHIASDANLPKPRGSITYCTTGIVLRQLMFHPDDLFDNISHLVIDEVHERDIDIDFLLTMIKNITKKRIKAGKRNPKVCLMSATADAEMFQKYFSFTDGTGEVTCPILHVEGRAFPVEKHYLEDIMKTFEETYPEGHAIWSFLDSRTTRSYFESEKKPDKTGLMLDDKDDKDEKDEKVGSVIEWDSHDDDPDSLQNQMKVDMVEAQVPIDLAAIMIGHIASTTEDGAILLFLPGLRDINEAERVLRSQEVLDVDFNDEKKFKIFILHSSISGEIFDDVFKPVPPGCRKIILATNVAETSITIDDIQYVIDTGKHKESNFHQMLRIRSLPCKWVSKSSVKQRSGRAGRVQNGSYYALFSKLRYKSMRPTSRPEMFRDDLQRTCLDIKVLGYKGSIQDFLAGAPEPPSPQAVTPLGRLLGRLPLKPSLGKMIILGIIFRCLDPMIILGALDDEILQIRPPSMKDESDAAIRGFGKGSRSDHIAMVNAFRALRHLEEVDGPEVMLSFANQKFLHVPKFHRVKKLVRSIQYGLRLSDLVSDAQQDDIVGAEYGGALLNENSQQDELIRALIVHGSYPHMGAWDHYQSKYQIVATEKLLVSIHPSSINHPMQEPSLEVEGITSPSKGKPKLLSFNTLALITDEQLVMQRTTAVTPFMVSLFGGTLERSDGNLDQVQVDQWLPFDVRSTDEVRGAQGTAAQTLLQFNGVLRQFESTVFRDLAKGEYNVDSEMSHILADAVKELLIKEQDIERATNEHELNLATSLQKFWNSSKKTSEKITLESPLEEEDPYESFMDLVESALEVPTTTESDSDTVSVPFQRWSKAPYEGNFAELLQGPKEVSKDVSKEGERGIAVANAANANINHQNKRNYLGDFLSKVVEVPEFKNQDVRRKVRKSPPDESSYFRKWYKSQMNKD